MSRRRRGAAASPRSGGMAPNTVRPSLELPPELVVAVVLQRPTAAIFGGMAATCKGWSTALERQAGELWKVIALAYDPSLSKLYMLLTPRPTWRALLQGKMRRNRAFSLEDVVFTITLKNTAEDVSFSWTGKNDPELCAEEVGNAVAFRLWTEATRPEWAADYDPGEEGLEYTSLQQHMTLRFG